MLGQTDVQLKEMGAFALGRLAQNADNQAGIVQVLLSLPSLAVLLKYSRLGAVVYRRDASTDVAAGTWFAWNSPTVWLVT